MVTRGMKSTMVATAVMAMVLAAAAPAGALSVFRLAKPASPVPLAADAGWLATVNHYREMAGEPPVTEVALWSQGAAAHSRYLVETGSTGHTEDPNSPFFTRVGSDAGRNSNVSVGFCNEREAVESFMRAPFHAIGVLDHRLTKSGFGLYRKPGTNQCAATLDVLRGRDGTPAAAATPWPGDGTTTTLKVIETETPDPVAGCAGAAGAGLPLVVQLPSPSSGVVAELRQDGVVVPSCAYDGTTYANANADDQSTGRLILSARNAAVVIPLVPLRAGSTYSVTLRSTASPSVLLAAWSFREAPANRILDTRVGNGAPAAKLGPGQTLNLQVTGRGGVPLTGISAVVLNVTVTEPTAESFLTTWPTGATRPVASSLNYVSGLTVANQVLVKLGNGGQVSLFNDVGSVHVIADVIGTYSDTLSSGSLFNSLPPSRVLDTRSGQGAPAAKIGPGGTIGVQVTGAGGVPASGVTAVALNVTVTETTADSFLTVWPAGQGRPDLSSSLNWGPGRTVPNLVIVGVGDGGRINLYNSAGSAHVLADVVGWYAGDAGTPPGSRLTAVSPVRLLDTRIGQGAPAGKVGPGGKLDLQVTNAAGAIPGTATAAVLNVTVTGPTAESYLTVWPAGAAQPVASSLNFVAGQTVANLVIVKLSAGGLASIYNAAGATHVIADVVGWFDPATTG